MATDLNEGLGGFFIRFPTPTLDMQVLMGFLDDGRLIVFSGQPAPETVVEIGTYEAGVTYRPRARARSAVGHVLGMARWIAAASRPADTGAHQQRVDPPVRFRQQRTPGVESRERVRAGQRQGRRRRRCGSARTGDDDLLGLGLAALAGTGEAPPLNLLPLSRPFEASCVWPIGPSSEPCARLSCCPDRHPRSSYREGDPPPRGDARRRRLLASLQPSSSASARPSDRTRCRASSSCAISALSPRRKPSRRMRV